MAGRLTDEGETDILTWYFKNSQVSRAADALYIGLYKDSTLPAETATLATITEETGTGYARIQLTDASWTITNDTASYAEQTFSAGSEWGNVYGYFLCNVASSTSGELLFVDHFTNGPYFISNGKDLDVTPNFVAA